MKQIKEIVVNTLIANGFSEAIVIEDRKYQLKIIERVLIGIWLAFSVISIRKTQIFLWVLAVFLAFLCEQIVDLIIRRFKYLNNKNNPWSDLAKQSISRSAYKRINIWFNLFILVFHFYFSVMPSNPILYFIVLELSAMLAIMENHFKQTIKDKFLILGTSILKGITSSWINIVVWS